ncbi:uncharacterized protein LOC135171596 [Diachasmimorpha longicaudata]|uniref:uncharacterized protein LOC135171596 n=1 Tax=Diachasmimorpha longicaudata TaxID=58733 RepID=UPI0030B86EEB
MKPQTMLVALLLSLVTTPRRTSGLIGYDCSGSSLNITSYSLLQIAQCSLPLNEPNFTEVNIELMQLNKYGHIQVDECRVQIDRTIHYCGMHSHVSIVHNYRREYYVELDKTECEKLHNSNSLQLSYNVAIDGLVKNVPNSRPITLAGRNSANGACKGTQYSDPFGTWDDVVVNAIIRIYYTSYTTTVELESNKITLHSGAKCNFLQGSCTDSTGIQAFWSTKPQDDCKFGKYTALYRGSAMKIEATDKDPVTYIVSNSDYTFSLEQRARSSTCGYSLIQTEIPKLFIMESFSGNTFPTNKIIDIENIDLIQYVNAKIIYVESHIKNQIKKLYHRIRLSQCEIQRTSLMNSLAIASFAPDMFAFNLMKGPGYHAIATGELVSIIKCTPVPVTLRKTENCFLEIPVFYNNETYFLTGISRMLVRRGTTIDCHSAIPTVFFIDGNWYTFNPDILKAPRPLIFNPTKSVQWEYERIENLATSGIYSADDMEKLRDRLLTKAETAAVVSNMVRAANGDELPAGTISIKHLLNREMLEEMTESAVSRAWDKIKTFGNIVSVVIGVVTLIQMIIGLVNVIIHGYTLHDVFGCSFRILGAICGSLTHFILYKSRQTQHNVFPRDYERQMPDNERITRRKSPEEQFSLPIIKQEPESSQTSVIDPLLMAKARSTVGTHEL